MRVYVSAIISLTIIGCAWQSPLTELETPVGAPESFPISRYQDLTNTVYEVTDSRLTVLVFRSGRLKHLGHNHVLVNQRLAGMVSIGEDSAFADLYLPVASFVIDAAPDRALAGKGFEVQPKPKDINGTRANLFGPKVLDAGNFPFVRIELVRGDAARATITLKDQTRTLDLPVTWAIENNTLTANTHFTLSQQALGLTPFSILGGAIGVADEIHINLSLTAKKH